jgi:hypothetical protein
MKRGTRTGIDPRPAGSASAAGGRLHGVGQAPLLHEGSGFSGDEFVLVAVALVVLLGLLGLGWQLTRGRK